MKVRKARITLAAGLAAAGTLWMSGAAGAQATVPDGVTTLFDESCSVAGCSSVVNDSAVSATALFNWCTSGGGTGDSTTTRPTCGNQRSLGLAPRGGHTPYNQDWDTLQVDAGWCYKVKFVRDLQTDFTRTYDRRGRSAVWVKVEDNADAHVQAQSTTSCPA